MSKVTPAHLRAAKASTAAPSSAAAPSPLAALNGAEAVDSSLWTEDGQSTVHGSAVAAGSSLPSTAHRPPSTAGLTAFEAEVVEVFVGVSKVFGLPKSYGEIYGLLFASAEPLSFSEIQEKLGISKGSVSQGLRALRELGAVRVAGTGKPETGNLKPEDTEPEIGTSEIQVSGFKSQVSAGARGAAARDRYVPVLELRRVVSAFLQASIEPQLTQSRANLTRAGELLQPAATALSRDQRDLLLQRLGKLQTWHHRAKSLLPWAVRFLG